VRQKTYSLDESEVKPYFPLDRMCEAIFDCAYQLFGLKFKLREDIASYHPDVQTYEVVFPCHAGFSGPAGATIFRPCALPGLVCGTSHCC
jgi:hypothetical protein